MAFRILLGICVGYYHALQPHAGPVWEVVGDTGYAEVPTSSGPLLTDSVVMEDKLDGDQLQYNLIAGRGPEQAQVNLSSAGKTLVRRLASTASMPFSRMRVFLLGATGTIGSSILGRLLADGHSVLALVRHEKDVASLGALGVQTRLIPGGFSDHAAIAAAAAESDAVIDAARHDETAIAGLVAIGRALGSIKNATKFFVGTTGARIYGDDPSSIMKPHKESSAVPGPLENAVLNASSDSVRTTVLLPPWVHGIGVDQCGMQGLGADLKGDYYDKLIAKAKATGISYWPDDGNSGGTISTVHTRDLGDLYALTLYSLASGALHSRSFVNGCSGKASRKEIAAAIAVAAGNVSLVGLRAPHQLVDVEDCSKALGFGWKPTRPSLVEFLERVSISVLPSPSQAKSSPSPVEVQYV